MSLSDTKKGDTLTIVTFRRGQSASIRSAEVVAAGPKYVTCASEYGRSDKFHRDTGAGVTNYSPTVFAYKSLEAYEQYQESMRLRARACALTNRIGWERHLTDETLRALIALIEGQAA
jgi:hypothetical protein